MYPHIRPSFCHMIKHTTLGMLARLSPTRYFQWTMLTESRNPRGEGNTRQPNRKLMLPSHTTHTHLKHTHRPAPLTPPKVLSQERFHIPLAWLARKCSKRESQVTRSLLTRAPFQSHHTVTPNNYDAQV